jgi:hypothetical protein
MYSIEFFSALGREKESIDGFDGREVSKDHGLPSKNATIKPRN